MKLSLLLMILAVVPSLRTSASVPCAAHAAVAAHMVRPTRRRRGVVPLLMVLGMVVGPGYVFGCIPKAASRSARQWLIENYEGRELPGSHHRWDVPPEHAGKPVFVIVRHPYGRLLSLWRHARLWPGHAPTLADHLATVRAHGSEPEKWSTQAEFISRVGATHVVQYEHLWEGLCALPFVTLPIPDFPWVRTEKCDYDLTPDDKAVIREVFSVDFAMFGYPV